MKNTRFCMIIMIWKKKRFSEQANGLKGVKTLIIHRLLKHHKSITFFFCFCNYARIGISISKRQILLLVALKRTTKQLCECSPNDQSKHAKRTVGLSSDYQSPIGHYKLMHPQTPKQHPSCTNKVRTPAKINSGA